jgi:hypothetical protein
VAMSELRRTEQGHVIEAAALRSFIQATLGHEAIADAVNDLLFAHVVERRYHPSVVAASLRPFIIDVLDAATQADWQHIVAELTSEAREALGLSASPDTPSTGPDDHNDGMREPTRASAP